MDTLAEQLADEKPDKTGVRWALTPSVVQHIGGRSSMSNNNLCHILKLRD